MSEADGRTLKEKIFALLDKNPLLTPKLICSILRLSYKENRDYVSHVKSAWKYDTQRQRGLKCSIHAWRGWTILPISDKTVLRNMRAAAEMKGWVRTRARNRWLLFKDQLGRLQWFETGRVNLYVRKPASLGNAIQLIARAFSWTEIITDLKVLQVMFKGIRFKGAHYVFDLGFRGEKPVTVDIFGPSMGMVIKLFDRSHPTGLEALVHYPDWQEKNEMLFHEISEFLHGWSEDMRKPPAPPTSKYWA